MEEGVPSSTRGFWEILFHHRCSSFLQQLPPPFVCPKNLPQLCLLSPGFASLVTVPQTSFSSHISLYKTEGMTLIKQARHPCEFPVVAGGALAQCLGAAGSGHPGWFAQVGPWTDVTCFLSYIRNSHPHPSRSDLGPWMNSKAYFTWCLCACLGVFT